MAKKIQKETTTRIINCADCGNDYESTMPHRMFCPARTCTQCLTTGSEVLEIVDGALGDEEEPIRLCEQCKWEDEVGDDTDDYDEDEEDEFEDDEEFGDEELD